MKFKVEFEMTKRFCPFCPFCTDENYEGEENCLLQKDESNSLIRYDQMDDENFEKQLENCPLEESL